MMMLAGLPVPNDAVQELAVAVREAAELWRDLGQSGVVADELADRLERALADEVKVLARRSTSGRSCSTRSRILRRSWPSFAPSCSPITSGDAGEGID